MALDGLSKLITGLQSLKAVEEVPRIVANNTTRLVELEQEQLAAGIDRSGSHRSDEYAPLTKYLKPRLYSGLGAEIDRVTFFATGRLYGSLKANVAGLTYKIESPLPSFDKMVDRIGEENYGLDPEQRLEFATTVTLPEFGRVMEEKTGLHL